MRIDDHQFRAENLLESAAFLKDALRFQESVWIYALGATHLFNSALHLERITLEDQGLATHNAGYYCYVEDTERIFYSDRGDVIHADMPPTPPLEGPLEVMQLELRQIEAIAVPALHQDRPVTKSEANSVAGLALSMRETIDRLKRSSTPQAEMQ